MSEYISKNQYLTLDEMTVNARYIYRALTGWGWSDHAICAMLGNMQVESTINPGIYEGLDTGSTSNGFGIVQWTPNTKYKTWADENGYSYGDLDGQLARIKYELENGLQWIETETFPLSFKDFTTSDLDITYLTYAFMYNYERPAELAQPHRVDYAENWFERLTNGSSGDVTPSPVKSNQLPLIYKYIVTRRR